MTRAKQKSKNAGKEFLWQAFSLEQNVLKSKLDLSVQSVTHPGLLGEVNELHFVEVLRKYLPRRYAVDSGIVLDSMGATSDQIDVIVYDNQYTPTLLDQNNHRFIPAEALYAVFEVKPTITKANISYAGEKAASVRLLKRTSVLAAGQSAIKTPCPIVAGIVAIKTEWKTGFKSNSFSKAIKNLSDLEKLDVGMAVEGGCFEADGKSISIFDSKLPGLGVFLFRLLHRLQMMGTAPAVDWNAYANSLEMGSVNGQVEDHLKRHLGGVERSSPSVDDLSVLTD
jgi:hypothetical protein